MNCEIIIHINRKVHVRNVNVKEFDQVDKLFTLAVVLDLEVFFAIIYFSNI